MDRLTTMNPDYDAVRLLDRQIASLEKLRGEKKDRFESPALYRGDLTALNSSFNPPPEEDPALGARLTSEDKIWSGRLSKRLAESSKVSAQYARQQATDEVWKQYRQQYENLSSDASDSLMKILGEDADKFTRLNLQIMVLKVNANPSSPKIAPEGYWAQKLSEKSSELSALKASNQDRINQLTDALQARERDLRQRADADAASKIEEAEAKLRADMNERAAGYEKLLSGRRAAVLETARDFDREMIASIDAGSSAAGEASKWKAESFSRPSADQEWGAGLANSIERLRRQRTRRYDLVREETKRIALDIASSQRLQIVDWKPSAGRRDLTSLIVRESAGFHTAR